jgi:hypothetical protein
MLNVLKFAKRMNTQWCAPIALGLALLAAPTAVEALPIAYLGPIKAIKIRPEGVYIDFTTTLTDIPCTVKTGFFIPKEEGVFRTFVNQVNIAMIQAQPVWLYSETGQACNGLGYIRLTAMDYIQ